MKYLLIMALGILVVVLTIQNQGLTQQKNGLEKELQDLKWMKNGTFVNQSGLRSAYDFGYQNALTKCK